ncbi:YbdD/YjiX family protein [Hyphomicrobium sp.]|uniref:YbdD/YjiX family protein n=1 Tax=Hyphomicrobium sp. TaxID=82 RepID=UPI002D77D9B7|nr:YbdD/YjiX family protein [Hyphomicrobium sp.]HET6388591.1 YbdD/YjiX family protein [Hyphomicrobium sp.]
MIKSGTKLISEFTTGIAKTARLMIGVPDYEAYVAHRRSKHPDEPVMSYEDFFRERQASRYGEGGGKISRCC